MPSTFLIYFPGDPLEVDESQLLSDYFEFFSDVYPELENVCGGSLEAFRCCRNASDHLRGNVYVQFIQDPAIAMDIATRLSRRWYAGRQIVARLAYLGQGWRSAVCGRVNRSYYLHGYFRHSLLLLSCIYRLGSERQMFQGR